MLKMNLKNGFVHFLHNLIKCRTFCVILYQWEEQINNHLQGENHKQGKGEQRKKQTMCIHCPSSAQSNRWVDNSEPILDVRLFRRLWISQHLMSNRKTWMSQREEPNIISCSITNYPFYKNNETNSLQFFLKKAQQ